MGLHLAAERVQLRPAIAQALLGQVAVIGEAVEAVGPGQVDAGMDQLPQDVLQLSGVFQHRLLLQQIKMLEDHSYFFSLLAKLFRGKFT